jgi:hypothetical protein
MGDELDAATRRCMGETAGRAWQVDRERAARGGHGAYACGLVLHALVLAKSPGGSGLRRLLSGYGRLTPDTAPAFGSLLECDGRSGCTATIVQGMDSAGLPAAMRAFDDATRGGAAPAAPTPGALPIGELLSRLDFESDVRAVAQGR